MSAGLFTYRFEYFSAGRQTTLYDNRVNYDDRRTDCKKQYFTCKMMLATMAAKGMVLWKFDIPQPFLFRLWIINGSTEGPDVSPDASLGSSYKTFSTNIFLGICL